MNASLSVKALNDLVVKCRSSALLTVFQDILLLNLSCLGSVRACLVFLLTFFSFYAHADSERILDPSQLAEQTQIMGRSVYKSIVSNSGEEPQLSSLKALKKAVNSSASKLEAVSLILKNRSLIQYYIDDVEVFFF
ncbi:MAG: hypothetical protein V2J13_11280, partial [Cycloclasticus sp.]|nr:hypothetical protein [Cycloclasticus sp.]